MTCEVQAINVHHKDEVLLKSSSLLEHGLCCWTDVVSESIRRHVFKV